MNIILKNSDSGKTTKWSSDTKGLIYSTSRYFCEILRFLKIYAESSIKVERGSDPDIEQLVFKSKQIKNILKNLEGGYAQPDGIKSLKRALKRIQNIEEIPPLPEQ